jgi:pSer/pThr/pTyr-binding forkhead associated (FHA) protein
MRLHAAEREGLPFLATRDSDGQQRLFTLLESDDRLTIGRDLDCAVPITWDPAVSRVHAELQRVGAAWTIVDDGLSRNGTFVGQQKVSARFRLSDGLVVRIGSTLLEYREPRPSLNEATVVADSAAVVSVTPAQRRVLVCLARPCAVRKGFSAPASNQEIAAELFLTVGAVKATLSVLFVKFGVASLAQNQKRARLVERVLSTGVVSQSELSA